MRHRSRHLLTILLALSLVTVFATVSPAFGASVRSLGIRPLRIAPLAGGEDINTAVDLPASPVSSALDAFGDTHPMDDVYKVYLNAGEMLTLSLTAPDNTDFLVAMYRPGSSSIWLDDPLYGSWGPSDGFGYPQQMRFVAGTTGWHYIDIAAYDGVGTYTMTWSKGAPPVNMARYAGGDRYQTAMQISQAGWANGTATHVVLATGENFADALAASALAGSYDCPVLLTKRLSAPTGLLAEIDRLRGSAAGTVMIVGSGSAVDTAVANALTTHGLTVDRIAGSDRYATAAQIAHRVRDHEVNDLGHAFSGQAFVCLGTNFPDALASSPYAARMKMPVLLVKTNAVPAVTKTALTDLGVTKAFVIGGTGTVSDAAKGALGVTAERLYGADRFDTSGVVADYAIAHGWAGDATVGLAIGRKFPDALGGGPAMGKVGATMLLTEAEWLSEPTYSWVYAHRATLANMRVFGSDSTVSDYVFSEFLDARDGIGL